ncbi:hypothetical protein IG631_03983 [Alternaria alternata]|nr:hypothetical protein IG631_03983 [Alternaria alternata]
MGLETKQVSIPHFRQTITSSDLTSCCASLANTTGPSILSRTSAWDLALELVQCIPYRTTLRL